MENCRHSATSNAIRFSVSSHGVLILAEWIDRKRGARILVYKAGDPPFKVSPLLCAVTFIHCSISWGIESSKGTRSTTFRIADPEDECARRRFIWLSVGRRDEHCWLQYSRLGVNRVGAFWLLRRCSELSKIKFYNRNAVPIQKDPTFPPQILIE